MSTEQVAIGPAQLNWFKSSYSGPGGGDCVEVAWFKSSYSGSAGGDCVEVAVAPNTVHIRDSKNAHGAILRLPAAGWTAFVSFAGDHKNVPA
ncbi:DUF397 domain-containing protein [Streptomyces sp. NPDC058200]|uniref:DUF397 domain-containing protein n=1 Tax=Streptomyces sp. NPDC058200 TaxID=3346378 RepID=UPI0036E3AE4D